MAVTSSDSCNLNNGYFSASFVLDLWYKKVYQAVNVWTLLLLPIIPCGPCSYVHSRLPFGMWVVCSSLRVSRLIASSCGRNYRDPVVAIVLFTSLLLLLRRFVQSWGLTPYSLLHTMVGFSSVHNSMLWDWPWLLWISKQASCLWESRLDECIPVVRCLEKLVNVYAEIRYLTYSQMVSISWRWHSYQWVL